MNHVVSLLTIVHHSKINHKEKKLVFYLAY